MIENTKHYLHYFVFFLHWKYSNTVHTYLVLYYSNIVCAQAASNVVFALSLAGDLAM